MHDIKKDECFSTKDEFYFLESFQAQLQHKCFLGTFMHLLLIKFSPVCSVSQSACIKQSSDCIYFISNTVCEGVNVEELQGLLPLTNTALSNTVGVRL